MKFAVIGCGVVGSGVAEIAENKPELLASECGGEEVSLKYILDIKDLSDRPYAGKVIRDIDVIVNDPEIGLVVETMGGTEPAFTFCMKCLNAGKSVVTSNKELVANKAEELFEAAVKNGVQFRFEAAVCGGIPVINTMFSDLGANEITGFAGILNGTTNFILTKMIKEKASFEQALKTAQEKGYAEKDPTADIEGLDACRKTCILSSIAFGTHFRPSEVYTEGITKITLEDASYASAAGADIKLLGRAEKNPDETVTAMVTPAFVYKDCLLSGVSGVNNALLIKGDSVGQVILSGPGAGKEATASAVVGDVLECVRIKKNASHYHWNAHKDGVVRDKDEAQTALYFRGFAKDKKAAVNEIREAFDSVRFLSRENAPENEIAFITSVNTEKELTETADGLKYFTAAAKIRIFGE